MRATTSRNNAAEAAIPGSRLEVFERAGHFPHQDEPSRFAEVLLDFLATTEPATADRALLRERLANDPGTEWGVVRAELGKINRIRLLKLVEGVA